MELWETLNLPPQSAFPSSTSMLLLRPMKNDAVNDSTNCKQDKEINRARKTLFFPSLLRCVLYKQAVKPHQDISNGI